MRNTIEKTLHLTASRDRVWRAITDPSEISAWFGESAELDLRPGGEGWFGWASHGRFAVRIEVIQPPERLTWRWARKPEVGIDDGESTLVEWTLSDRPEGGTTLRLRESGFTAPEHHAENRAGWRAELQELVEHLGEAEALAG